MTDYGDNQIVWVTGTFAVIVPDFTEAERAANKGLTPAEWHANQITAGDVTFSVNVHGDETLRVPEKIEVDDLKVTP